MELAIPIIAIGGLFVISNQKNKKKESFELRPTKITLNNKTSIPTPPASNLEYTDLAGRIMKINDQDSNMIPYFGKTKNGH